MLMERSDGYVGVIEHWFTRRRLMAVGPGTPGSRRDVTVMDGDEFFDALAKVTSGREHYLCSSTLSSKTDWAPQWTDCSAMPSVFARLREAPKAVVVAEAVDLGAHERDCDGQYPHADGVALWRPGEAFLARLRTGGVFGSIDVADGRPLDTWKEVLSAADVRGIDAIVTHNFNSYYNYLIGLAARSTLGRDVSLFNDITVGHFTCADPLLNLQTALMDDSVRTALVVAPSTARWNWMKIHR